MILPVGFTQSPQEPVLYVNGDTSAPGWSAFLFLGNPEVKDLPPTIDLKTSWQSNLAGGGCYIFGPRAPVNPGDFVSKLEVLLSNISGGAAYRFFAWIRDPDASSLEDSQNQILQATISDDGSYLINNNARFEFGGYIYLSITQNCRIAYKDALQLFLLDQPFSTGGIVFNNSQATTQSNIVNNRAYLPFSGPSRGTFRFAMQMAGSSDLTGYNMGLRYFYPKSPGSSDVIAILVPLIDLSYNQPILFQVGLDPGDPLNLNTLNPWRTFLAFDDPAAQLATDFRTDFGHRIDFVPVVSKQANPDGYPFDLPTPPCAKLLFSQQKKDSSNSFGDSLNFYLGPQGSFALAMDEDPAGPYPIRNLMCGLSGVETVSFFPRFGNYAGDLLWFSPQSPAYAPIFPLDTSAQNSGTQAGLLNDTYLTSWTGVLPNAGRPANADPVQQSQLLLRYVAQPKGASLYNKGSDPRLLPFFAPTAADFTSDTQPVFCPMLPFSGLDLPSGPLHPNADDVLAFEVQIVSPFRKHSIETKTHDARVERTRVARRFRARQASAGSIVKTTTPQGFYAEVETVAHSWQKLLLAMNFTEPGLSDTISLEFMSLGETLRSAFQTNQQFLVISCNPNDSEGKPVLGVFDHEMHIEGWPFLLNVPRQTQPGDYANVLIFKFCHGSLLDRVQNTRLWTNSADFNRTDNDGLADLSAWLTAYVLDGVARSTKGDPNFLNFATKVSDPNWNGILALKTDISLEAFPDSLKGLIAGIDLTRFNAHHFGINANYVAPDAATGELTPLPNSSLFGLIDYIDQLFEIYQDNMDLYKTTVDRSDLDPFYFTVLTLKVLFENSKIESFQSYILFGMNNLFGNALHLIGNENLLILSGHLEDHDGVPSYSFTESGDNKLTLVNSILYGVEILRASFATVNAGTGNDMAVQTRFSFWGYMNFAKLDGIDLFSFGSEPVIDPNTGQLVPGFNSQEGLCFSNLGVTMDFDVDVKDDTVANKVFTFDPNHIAFDLAQSTTRVASLYAHFPVEVAGLLIGDSSNQPSTQGYLNANTPDLQIPPPSGAWYGLELGLNMGSLGALAGGGTYGATLLLTWGIGNDSGASAAIKLPGVDTAAKMLGLQGVIKLNIESIQLLVGQVKDSTDPAYLLLLKNIGIKILAFTFPSSANIAFYLFGNPNANAKPGSLGWYVAYNKNNGRQRNALAIEA